MGFDHIKEGMKLWATFNNKSSLLNLQRNMNCLVRSALGVGKNSKTVYIHWLGNLELTIPRCTRLLKNSLNRIESLDNNMMIRSFLASYPRRIDARKRKGLTEMYSILEGPDPPNKKLSVESLRDIQRSKDLLRFLEKSSHCQLLTNYLSAGLHKSEHVADENGVLRTRYTRIEEFIPHSEVIPAIMKNDVSAIIDRIKSL
ncbi:hypothetical protein H311_00632, partial [Anncaliia algerae PRA109]